MALGIFLTTTGTLDPVIIDDMGALTFPHPTVDYNLLHDVSEDEIQKSANLQKLIDDGHVILKDDLGDVITDVQAAGPHKHPAGDIEDFSAAVSAQVDVSANTAARHARQHDVTSVADHNFPGGGTTFLRDDGTFITPPISTHAGTHEDGGVDEISVAGLSGELADPQPPKSHTHTAAQVTDFDTEVSNNTDVAANTSARHTRKHVVTATDDHEFPAVPAGKYLKDDGTWDDPGGGANVTNEPMGFPNRSDSVVSWDDVSKTFTIAPAVTSFDVWVMGTKYTKSAPETLVGDGTDFTIAEGIWFFYYDDTGTLTASQTFWDLSDTAQVYIIYWDNTNLTAIAEIEERHGLVMDWATHKNLHLTRGTQYVSGLAPGDITIGDGDSDIHAQLSISNGQIADEDIYTDIIDDNPQDLSLPAQIPVYYKTGAAGLWRKTTATNFPVKEFSPTDRLAYNQFTGGAWQQTEVANNDFVLAHIFALPDVNNPVVAIQGENEYSNITAAQEGAETELKSLRVAGLPSAEWTPICTLIFQTSDSYANTVQARIRLKADNNKFIDWRGTGISPAPGQGPQGSDLHFKGTLTKTAMEALTNLVPGDWCICSTFEGKHFTYDGSRWVIPGEVVRVTNQTGGIRYEGDVVIVHQGIGRAADGTTVIDNYDVLGAVVTGGANGAEITVAVAGLPWNVSVAGAANIGDFIFTNNVQFTAYASGTGYRGGFGQTLYSKGTGTANLLCWLFSKETY
jgi:hypothetical protein